VNNKPGAIIVEGHVQGLSNTRALGEAGVPVIVLDTHNCIARHSKYCKDFYKCPDYLSNEFIDFLIDLCKEKNLQGWSIFPSNDHIIFKLSENLDRIGKFYKTTIPPPGLLQKIYNKEKLLREAEKVDIPCPVTFYPEKSNVGEIRLKFPVITKGKFGLTFSKTFGRKVFFAKDKKQLKEQFVFLERKTDLTNTFVQEIIPDVGYNKTISFTAFCIKGELKTFWIGQKIREHPWTFGTATYTQSIYNQVVYEQSLKLLRQLNYTGICEVEYLYHPVEEKYMLIEINPRTWLWVALAKANGVNYALYAYNYLNGIETNYPHTYEQGVKWRNYWTDLFYSYQAILKGKLNVKTYRNSLKSSVIYAVRSKSDPKPFREMTKMLLALARRR